MTPEPFSEPKPSSVPASFSVLILHNVPSGPGGAGGAGFAESDAGVLAEVAEVQAALAHRDVSCRVVGVRTLRDLNAVLCACPESVVFNLVESLHDHPEEANLVPAVCESFSKGCTGNDTHCLLVTLDKGQTKSALEAEGLPTPRSVLVPLGQKPPLGRLPRGRCIVKPVRCDASEGIDAASVAPAGSPALARAVRKVHTLLAQPALVEQFLDGAELNVSLLQLGGRVHVMPLAQIDFSAFPADRPRIVDYAAKWLADTFEFNNTPRIIPAPLPARTAQLVRKLALRTWNTFGCRDYVRVDFRLDKRGRPFILEVNANPDISPDGGFAAAIAAANIPFDEFVLSMVINAHERMQSRVTGGTIAASGVAGGTGPQGLTDTHATSSAGEVPGPASPAAGPEAASAASAPAPASTLVIRWSLPSDRQPILDFMWETKFFRDDEMEIAREVLDDALAKGPAGHYQSLTAQREGHIIGWICFGPTPCTLGTFDIYWMGVSPRQQGRGLGRALLQRVEEMIVQEGGRLSVIETSGRPIYESTRGFYLKTGYHEAARLPDFYAPGDAKVVYLKRLGGPS